MAAAVGIPLSELNSWLIEQHYREMGCDTWDRHRVWRLCAKLQRTEAEMAALLRYSHAELKARLANGFSKQDGLLLTLLEAEIDLVKTGEMPRSPVFCFTDKGGVNGRS